MARYLVVMIDRHDDGALSGWDYAIPVVGATAALGWAVMVHLRYRARVAHERHFGESLRDQINRQLAQLDYGERFGRLANLIVFLLLPIVVAFATIFASWRINGLSFSNVWFAAPIVFMIGWAILCVGGTFLWARRQTQRKTLPRKRRLEALLKELDGQ
jgi:hypothetical protein